MFVEIKHLRFGILAILMLSSCASEEDMADKAATTYGKMLLREIQILHEERKNKSVSLESLKEACPDCFTQELLDHIEEERIVFHDLAAERINHYPVITINRSDRTFDCYMDGRIIER